MGRPAKPRTDPLDVAKRHQGLRLKAARLVLGLEVDEAAALAGVSKKAFEAYESGQNFMQPLTAFRFFQQTEIPMEFIFGGDLRRTGYELAQQLTEACATTGAAIGGSVPEWPMAAKRAPGRIPKRTSRGGTLHEG